RYPGENRALRSSNLFGELAPVARPSDLVTACALQQGWDRGQSAAQPIRLRPGPSGRTALPGCSDRNRPIEAWALSPLPCRRRPGRGILALATAPLGG